MVSERMGRSHAGCKRALLEGRVAGADWSDPHGDDRRARSALVVERTEPVAGAGKRTAPLICLTGSPAWRQGRASTASARHMADLERPGETSRHVARVSFRRATKIR